MPDLTRLVRRAVTSLRRSTHPSSDAPGADVREPDARETTRRLAALTEAKDHRAAVALAEERYPSCAHDKAFLKQVRSTASAAGAMGLQHRALLDTRRAWPGSGIDQTLATFLGRWRETDPAWTPSLTVDGSPVPRVTDPVPGRVLHVLKISMPHRQSGYSMRTYYTLVGQQRAGLDPVAVTALDFPRSVGVDDAPAEEVVGGVRHHRLLRPEVPAREPFDAYLDAWAQALVPVVLEERPEVIHVHSGNRGYESALVALAVGRATGVPVVYEVRGFFESLWTSDTAWSEQSEVYRRRFDTEARCMGAADAVVTLSESMKADIVARGISPDQVHVVPNGVDTTVFGPRERDADLAARLGLQDRFVFGYVSNLDHYREGQELLIDAAVGLREAGIAATALIVGDGARRAELEEHARRRGAQDVVVFTGRVPHDQVLDYYALLDVFVIPRVDERAARLVTPLKPYEAMAVGIPLVVSDLPALREITGEGTRSESFRVGDADDLTRTLAALAADPGRRAELADRARSWVVSEREWSGNGRRYAEVYARVTGEDPADAPPSTDR